MKKIDYVEEIKKSAKDIDFDEATKILFEDYVDFNKTSAKNFLKTIQQSNRENFFKVPYEHVDYIYFGNVDRKRAQNMCYMYVNDDKGTCLKYVYLDYGEPDNGHIEFADIPNPENFVKQFLNLAYAVGMKFVKGKPKDPKQYHYYIHLSNGEEYCSTRKYRNAFSYFYTLCHRYLSYNMSLYIRRIMQDRSLDSLDKLINASEESKKLYMNAKQMFDNFDFLYAVMKSLDSKRKMEIFNKCVDKNESYMNHRYMDNLFNYVDTATSFDRWGIPERVVFLQDIAEKRKNTELARELYDKLTNLYDDKLAAIEMFTILETEAMQRKMLDYLNTGETNTSKIFSKYTDITIEHFGEI